MRQMRMTAVVVIGLAAGCGGHKGSSSSSGAAAGTTSSAATAATAATGSSTTTPASALQGPGSVNLLAPSGQGASASFPGAAATSSSSASGATSSGATSTGTTSTTSTTGTTGTTGTGTAGTGTATAGTTGTGTGTGTAGTAAAGTATSSPATGGSVTPGPAAPTGPQLWGTIPPTLTTGFDGTLYFVGEQLVPGSYMEVFVNGTFAKVLPATFHSSETLGVYVYLTVPADYTFVAVAPDGTRSTPATFTVANGGVSSLFGLNAPEVQMVYPPALDTAFTGTVWLLGDHFMPGSVVTVTMPGLPPYVVPLLWVNQTTVGWITATPLAGNVTLQVTNPTALSSTALTVTVGQGSTTPGAQPQAYAPSGVSSPFVGSVHLVGSDLVSGAAVEWRPLGSTTATSTQLVIVSSAEAWWTLIYPLPGQYEIRVVNPGGAATAWQAFDVR